MSEAYFSIAYDGPALSNGTMDVRDLAPALLAIGQLFDAGNAALNGDSAQIRVEVRASDHGSFEISFQVMQTFGQQIVGLLSGDEVTAAIHLKELLVTGGYITAGGLIWLVKRLRGDKPDRIEKVDAQNIRITYNGETFVAPLKLLRLYQDIAVRDAVHKLVQEPLEKDGIDKFSVVDNGAVIESVNKEEAAFFANPEVQEAVVLESTHRAAFSIISLAFKEDNKWRLNDGNNQISATINDEDFIRRVDRNQVSFSKGDILVCDVHVTQKEIKGTLKTEYVVERVVEHKRAARQLPLLIEDSSAPEDSV